MLNELISIENHLKTFQIFFLPSNDAPPAMTIFNASIKKTANKTDLSILRDSNEKHLYGQLNFILTGKKINLQRPQKSRKMQTRSKRIVNSFFNKKSSITVENQIKLLNKKKEKRKIIERKTEKVAIKITLDY